MNNLFLFLPGKTWTYCCGVSLLSSRLSQRFFFVLSVHSFYYSAVLILVHLLYQLTLHNFGNSPKEIPEIPAPCAVSLSNKYRLKFSDDNNNHYTSHFYRMDTKIIYWSFHLWIPKIISLKKDDLQILEPTSTVVIIQHKIKTYIKLNQVFSLIYIHLGVPPNTNHSSSKLRLLRKANW